MEPHSITEPELPSRVAVIEAFRKGVSCAFTALFIATAAFARPHGFDEGWREACEHTGGLLLIIAALGRVWAYAHIGGRKNTELCRDGPYSLTRNPLYFFSFLGVCGAALALQSVALAFVSAVFFLLYYHFVIRSEEHRLAALFGDAFAQYCRDVPRFWPRLAAPAYPTGMQLSPRLFARNLTEVFWFLAAILVIEGLEWAKVRELWPTIRLG